MSQAIQESLGGVLVIRGPATDDSHPAPTQEELILQNIDALERKYLMPRVAREVFIVQAEERGAALGLTLAQLRTKNKGYAALKTLDEQIAALRAQL